MRYLALFVSLLFSQAPLAAEERILLYDIDIEVEQSGDLTITEQITVNAEGNNIRRGIFRTFPTKYKDRLGNRYSVDFDVIEVLRDGASEPFFTENLSNGVKVYIGSEHTFLDPGVYTYTLKFRTDRQIGFFDDFDELYFNAIGGDWAFEIDSAVVRVDLPEGADIIQYAAYSGPAGSTDCACNVFAAQKAVTYSTTRSLQPGDWFTIAVGWQKGIVHEPSGIQKAARFLLDNKNVIIGLFGLMFTFWFYYRAWEKVGRDPGRGTIIPRFDPPKGFTPAATRYLMKMAFSQKSFIASIVNMAVKGYLKIVQDEKKKYQLIKLREDTSELSEGEKAIAGALFSYDDSIDLDNKNHRKFSNARLGLQQVLKTEFQKGLFNVNASYSLKGVLMSVLFVALTFVSTTSGMPATLVITVSFFVMIIVFAYLLKAPTLIGRKIMDEIEGFEMYLNTAEKERMEVLHEPEMTPERFEKYLPYAIALGVENGWGRKFETQVSKSIRESYRPGWYDAPVRGHFYFSGFASDLGSSFSSAISSASTPPGSSSGSGGGGSSGGGGGGGGGGGW